MTSTVFASKRLEYLAVVTNVLDGNSVMISNRPSWGGGFLNLPNTIQLNGVQAPALNHQGGLESKESLENLILNKKVQFIESLDGGVSRGACLFLVKGLRQYTEEDCVNLIMVRNGRARWTGGSMVGDISAQTMEEAQRQAQAAHKGIWVLPAASPVLKPPICAESNAPVSMPQQAPINAAAAAETTSVPVSRTKLIVPLVVGSGILAFSVLLLWLRRRP